MTARFGARRWIRTLGLTLCVVALTAPANAFEFMDGRLQVHGFGEIQLRSIAKNYSSSDDLDLTQWYWVLNTELEYDFLPDGWGFVDLVQGYARVEVRYDCVWTRACGTMSSANTFGDRAKRLPRRLGSARNYGFDGQTRTGDTRDRLSVTIAEGDYQTAFAGPDRDVGTVDPITGVCSPGDPCEDNIIDPRNPAKPDLLAQIPNRVPGFKGSGVPDIFQDRGGLWDVAGVSTLFGIEGLDELLGTSDDPALNLFSDFLDYRFAMRSVPGPTNKNNTQTLGPWHPKDTIHNIGSLRGKPNPFNVNDPNVPVLGLGGVGGLAQPFRPAPLFAATDPSVPQGNAQGVYYPSLGLQREIGDLDSNLDQNFSQNDLSWNRGASQDDEKELKELYFDIEMFDARLWMRLGKQSIVWGKTELFRTTDQFNPQDVALASLPSLEESRISLWAARFVYSLYEVGPLDDVRVEFAFNYDEMEPADLGRCGEPYTVNLACNLTFGLFAHGLAGVAVAGFDRPPDPWENSEGWEGGARLEFRWSRFSFALMNFYGYHDFPFPDRIFNYSRNVDPATGRPRAAETSGPCANDSDFDGIGDDPECLAPGQTGPNNALQNHHANQQIFALICASSVGFSDLDLSACGQSVFNSQELANPATQDLTVAGALSMMLAGGSTVGPGSSDDGGFILSSLIGLPDWTEDAASDMLALLNRDLADPTPPPPGHPFGTNTLSRLLTDQQEALLGCGVFYGTHCDQQGGDLLNAEASVLMQSFPSVAGTPVQGLVLTAPGTVLPGTTGFMPGPPVGTRFDPATGGTVMIPGSRGPLDGGAYTSLEDGCVRPGPDVDGCNAGDMADVIVPGDRSQTIEVTRPLNARPLYHPVSELESALPLQQFKSEMAALSWNLVVVLVAQSGDPEDRLENDNTASWGARLLADASSSTRRAGGRQRNVRAPRLLVARRWRGGAALREAQRAGFLDGLRGGRHGHQLGTRGDPHHGASGQRFRPDGRHSQGRPVQSHDLGGPSYLDQLLEREPDLLLQLAVVLPVRPGLQAEHGGQRSLQRARHVHDPGRLLPGSPAAQQHLRL
jgi:hypothetical protein